MRVCVSFSSFITILLYFYLAINYSSPSKGLGFFACDGSWEGLSLLHGEPWTFPFYSLFRRGVWQWLSLTLDRSVQVWEMLWGLVVLEHPHPSQRHGAVLWWSPGTSAEAAGDWLATPVCPALLEGTLVSPITIPAPVPLSWVQPKWQQGMGRVSPGPAQSSWVAVDGTASPPPYKGNLLEFLRPEERLAGQKSFSGCLPWAGWVSL